MTLCEREPGSKTRAHLTHLPGVVHGVSDHLLPIGRNRDRELDGLRVHLAPFMGLLCELPIRATVEVFDDADARRFFLVVTYVDLE